LRTKVADALWRFVRARLLEAGAAAEAAGCEGEGAGPGGSGGGRDRNRRMFMPGRCASRAPPRRAQRRAGSPVPAVRHRREAGRAARRTVDVQDRDQLWYRGTVRRLSFSGAEAPPRPPPPASRAPPARAARRASRCAAARDGCGTGQTLVRFHGWDARFDEWIPSDSQRLRPVLHPHARRICPAHGTPAPEPTPRPDARGCLCARARPAPKLAAPAGAEEVGAAAALLGRLCREGAMAAGEVEGVVRLAAALFRRGLRGGPAQLEALLQRVAREEAEGGGVGEDRGGSARPW
jgi:hypothetical protein